MAMPPALESRVFLLASNDSQLRSANDEFLICGLLTQGLQVQTLKPEAEKLSGGRMPIKVGINGFGRIGRNIVRTALDDKDIQFVAVNDITDAKTLAHLLKYDSVLGNLPHNVTHTDDTISVEGKGFKVFKVKDPAEIDWASVGADIVIESTGLFTKGVDAKKHLRAP